MKDTRDDPRVKLPARTREVDLPSGTVLPSVPEFTEKVVGRVPAPSRAPRATESAVRRRADAPRHLALCPYLNKDTGETLGGVDKISKPLQVYQ